MNKKKKIVLLILIVLLIGVIGISYAYWYLNLSQTGVNRLVGSCFSMSLTNEKNDIHLTNAYPITNEEGKKLTPYSFTITNTCDLFASYTVNLEILEDNTLPTKYISSMVNNERILKLSDLEEGSLTLNNSQDSKVLAKGSLGSGDSVDYTLRLWMSEEVGPNDIEAMNKTFKSKVTVTALVSTYTPVDAGYNTLANAILANEYQTSPEISKQKIASKQTPDFSKTAPILIWNESKSNTTSNVSITMPHPDLVALKDSDERFKNLSSSYVLLPIGTGYTFNSETGKYDLTNVSQLDPTTLDYTNAKYYFCNAGYSTSYQDIVTVWKTASNCVSVYELSKASFTDGTATGSGGTSIKTRKYTLNGYVLTQIEEESDKSDKGLYQMEDDDGMSYYYRGSVTNNYVKFAGYYWRIIRINGDGSVRLLYAGTNENATGENLFNKTNTAFNLKIDNPAYGGFMYGTTLNESYQKTNANEVESNILNILNTWYSNHLLENESLIDINGSFCNDRSLSTVSNNGDGISITKKTYYGAYQRNYQTKSPILTCPNENDRFTVTTSKKGNKTLKYSIGLITVDELMLSGFADGYINKLNYTYTDRSYWTMSPGHVDINTGIRGCYLYKAGDVRCSNTVNALYDVRAVINVKGDAKISGGIGTSSSPYIIQNS